MNAKELFKVSFKRPFGVENRVSHEDFKKNHVSKTSQRDLNGCGQKLHWTSPELLKNTFRSSVLRDNFGQVLKPYVANRNVIRQAWRAYKTSSEFF